MAHRVLPLDRYKQLLAHALTCGAERVTMYTTCWHIAGNCEKPYDTVVHGRPERGRPSTPDYNGRLHVYGPGRLYPGRLIIQTRCRRCKRCLKTRANKWRGAALYETRMSSRTWAGTLTLRPEEHFRALSKARSALASQGIDFDTLDEPDQFRERCRALAPDLTKYIKRWRKGKLGLRYLLVTEKHESGLPHFHMLVHETPLLAKLTHRELSTQWHLGFERWRLINPQDPKAATYLCKYLAKSLECRVRNSNEYGVSTRKVRAHAIADQLIDQREIPSEPEW